MDTCNCKAYTEGFIRVAGEKDSHESKQSKDDRALGGIVLHDLPRSVNHRVTGFKTLSSIFDSVQSEFGHKLLQTYEQTRRSVGGSRWFHYRIK